MSVEPEGNNEGAKCEELRYENKPTRQICCSTATIT